MLDNTIAISRTERLWVRVKKTGRVIVFYAILLGLQVVLAQVLPTPFNLIQPIWIIATLLVLFWREKFAYWLVFIFYSLSELTSGAPFGSWLIAGSVGFFLLQELYYHWLTNRSVYSAALLSGSAIVSSRLIHGLALALLGELPRAALGSYFLFTMVEMILIASLTGLSFFLLSLFLDRFKGKRISIFSRFPL